MKRIFAFVLTAVMLFTMAACNLSNEPGETSNESTTDAVTTSTPEGTTPEGTTPGESTPNESTPNESAPNESAPNESNPGESTPNESAPNESAPIESAPNESNPGESDSDESTPKEENPTIPEIEVSLPEASKVIANIIGVVAASVEVSDDAQFVFVCEQYTNNGDFNGYKQVIFFEVAEAVVDSNGEVLKAHLKVKVGEAAVEIPEGVSSEDIVVGKDAIASYFIFEVSVNGEDVSFAVNDQNASANLSEVVYGAIAQMMGLESVADLEKLVMTAAIAQELEKNLMPIIAKALDGVLADLPTVSPAYIEHLQALFAALGQDIMTVTTDDVTGNTTVSLNIAALKKLLEEVEGKTVAEYLESVYGENVVGELSSFLKSLPDKKVKDIVNAAVTLAESTNVSVQEIYALIDMYILTVTGEEFSIEEQINERYNNTLAELLAEYNGVKPEEQDKFIESMKASFANAADMLETVSIDALLSSMFMGTNEGFIENLKATIDMFDEQIVYNLTVDADGYVLALNYSIGDLQYSMVVEGDDTIMTVSMPNGLEYVVTICGEGFNVVVKQDGEQIATGSLTVTEEIVGEDTVSTVAIDLRDDENDLLDLSAVLVNGTLTTLDAVVRGYDVWYEGYYDEETGEKFEVRHEEFVEFLAVEYTDHGEDGQVLNLFSMGNTITLTQNDNELTMVVAEGDEVIATGTLSVTETGLSVEVNDTTGQIFKAGIEIIDNEEGEDFIRIEYQDMVSVLGYEFNENGLKIAMYDENIEQIFAMLEVVNNAEGESFVHVIWGGEEFKFIGEKIEGGVRFTLSDEVAQSNIAVIGFTVNDEDALVVDIDLDQILIYPVVSEICYEAYYIAFDGAITIKID